MRDVCGILGDVLSCQGGVTMFVVRMGGPRSQYIGRVYSLVFLYTERRRHVEELEHRTDQDTTE